MNKLNFKYQFIWVFIALFPLFIYGQENDAYEKRWEEINQGIKYEKSRRPQGPSKEYIAPQSLNEERRYESDSKPSDGEIIYSREQRYNDGENKGVNKHIKDGKSEGLDDLSTPRSEAPKTEKSNNDRDFGDGTFFKYLFIIIAIVLVVFLIYHFFFKNAGKSNKEIKDFDYNQEQDINPETIEKSQLEKDLQKAISEENYRSAVRIYYVLLLKALINRNLIKWAKRKTNTHYLAEMTTHEEFENFNKSVNMYEWTWYGKNNPSKDVFERFSTFYDDFLKRLKDE